jgi:hypothetical protein
LQLIKEEALEISLKDEEKEANEIIVIIEENDENDERKMKNEYKTEESMGVKSVPLQIPISKKKKCVWTFLDSLSTEDFPLNRQND